MRYYRLFPALFMGALPRVVCSVVFLLSATGLRAQTEPVPPEVRAESLLTNTQRGQEGAVSCDRLEGAAQAFIDLGMKARSESLERATAALRLGERGTLRRIRAAAGRRAR